LAAFTGGADVAQENRITACGLDASELTHEPRGARCAGLEDRIGSLTPGKQADLIMIRTDDITLFPSNNAVGLRSP
jgi:cytosine/adenosine deaminase-related metal-dependent hydrolase